MTKRAAPRTAFKPGQSGNPGGKPVASRNQINKAFLEALVADFDQHGAKAIADARKDDPSGYMRCVASLLPKEFVIERPTDGLTDEQLDAIIAELRGRLADVGGGEGAPQAAEPAQGVPTLQ